MLNNGGKSEDLPYSIISNRDNGQNYGNTVPAVINRKTYSKYYSVMTGLKVSAIHFI